MRSSQEIWFRLRQEAADLAMFVHPPKLPAGNHPAAALLPDPVEVAGRLHDTAFARDVLALAGQVMQHRFPLLGLTVETGPRIEWRRDSVHAKTSGTAYFRRVPYLDFAQVGDHKVVWELNRHQHLVLLAQAYRFSGRREFLDEAFRQLESWLDDNPFLRGINWTSALEVAFRALSWSWLWMLAGSEMPGGLQHRFLTGLYRHGCFLEHNLSVYFSPNTHLLGEAVALHALGALFPSLPRATLWTDTGGKMVRDEIARQVRDDGSHFEQSAYYHVYALDFFLLHRALAAVPDSYDQRLRAMAEYLAALMGPSGVLPYFGDDDGGRLFHPYGDRSTFGRGTLASCAVLFNRPDWLRDVEDLHCQAAWWFPQPSLARTPVGNTSHPRLFRDAGVAVMCAGDRQVVIKAGGFGEGSGGHSHSDVLSLVARIGDHELLIDPGTHTYVADPAERNRFRGSASHNTVRIDGRDQAVPAGPFRWIEKPRVDIFRWEPDFLDATCAYAGYTHRRCVRLIGTDLLAVLDLISGPPGEHDVEQFWHLSDASDAGRFHFSSPAAMVEGWRSLALGAKQPVPVLRVACRDSFPICTGVVIGLSFPPNDGAVRIATIDGRRVLLWQEQAILSMR